MRILLDECVPARLARDLTGHTVTTVGRMRWNALPDGLLLRRAAAEFDVFLTVDQSLEFQQPASEIAIVTLISQSIERHALQPLIPDVLAALERIKPGERLRVGPLLR